MKFLNVIFLLSLTAQITNANDLSWGGGTDQQCVSSKLNAGYSTDNAIKLCSIWLIKVA